MTSLLAHKMISLSLALIKTTPDSIFQRNLFWTMAFCRQCKIGPSMLDCDLSNLGTECQRMVESGVDYLQLDIMDGLFVPNMTFGHTVVKCLRPKIPKAFLEMHMMVVNPEKWVSHMADAGADRYTFHVEATDDPMRCIRKIKENGMKVGIGVKPGTPVQAIFPFLDFVDVALIMTVEPGFGGQKFMKDMMPKVRLLRKMYPLLDIEVDGGIGPSTIQHCAEAGANMIVSGTAILFSDNPRCVISYLREVVKKAIKKPRLESKL